MKDESDEIKNQNSTKRRGIFFWLGRFVFILFALFFSILILIQLPPVQIWGARWISKKIEKTLHTKVSIGGFNLHPISDLSLTDVFIGSPEYPSDTMIRAKDLQVDFKSLWEVLSNRLTVEQITIQDGFINIEKKAGDTLTNLDVAMLRLLPDKDTSKAPFVLDLARLSFTQLQVNINDNTVGSLVKMVFPHAEISIDTLDMPGQYIKAEYIDFDEPLIHITRKVTEPVIRSSVKKQDKNWSFDVDKFKWTDGKFYIDDQNKPEDTSQVYGMDYAHLFLADLDIEMDSFSTRGWDISGQMIRIHALHQNGFELKTLSADDLDISENGVSIKSLELLTEKSHIRNSVDLGFSGFTDFKSFADSVSFNIPDADIVLEVSDIMALVPSLGKVSFLGDNRDETIVLKGDIDGRINRLRILNMDASMGGISMTGDFRSRDLTIKGSQLLNLDLKQSTVSTRSLKDLFPRMNIPPIVNKLGTVHFTGKFDGYPDDFVAYGTFTTALGRLTMDMNLNTVRGAANAKFSGTISMDHFDLGTLIDNKDLGRITMTGRVIEGSGLTPESLSADITAVMSSVVYKGYTYRNARLDGQITERLFNGTVDINDPNVEMHFEGTVDFRGKSPKLDFITRIDSIRLLDLGFGSKPIVLSGIFDVDFTTGKVDEFQGTLMGEKVTVRIDGVDYFLDSLSVLALIDSSTMDRFYHIKSDVASGVFSGQFDPVTLPNLVHQYLHKHYPSTIGPPKKILTASQLPRISWDLHIHDSGPWIEIAGFPGLVLRNTYTHGNLDLNTEHIEGFVQLPELHYGGFNVYGSAINIQETKGNVTGDLEVIAADLNENLFFEDVYVEGSGNDDDIKLRIRTDHIAEIIDELDLELVIAQDKGNWTFSINPIQLDLLGGSWTVPAGNKIEIMKNEFNLENFELVSNDRRIVVNDIDNKGIEAFITGFDVDYLNSLWVTDKFEFSGVYTLDLEVDNIYNIKKLSTVLHIPALKINNIAYGEWILNAGMDNPQDSVQIDLVMNNGETHLTGKGAYLPPIKSIPKEKQNYLRLDILATDFPLDFLEFLMGGNIRDTEGSVELALTLEGKVNQLNPSGKGKVYNGSTTIDYLGTAYSFHDQAFSITDNMIDLSGTRLYDVQGNYATVQGGLTHRYLKNLGLDARIISSRIIGLDVSSEENSSFYGRGIGSVDATFSGTVANAVMHINTTTAEGTHIYIPLSGAEGTTDKDFVIFLENGQLPVSKLQQFNLGGVSLTMDMNVTEEAIIEIIMDESGEILRAIGNGNLQIGMTRTGNLSMGGNFRITQGDYLFTNFGFIKKPFDIEEGSEIEWIDNPYDAVLNVKAKYKDLEAPVYNLIQEYLVNVDQNLVRAARERTPVDMTLILTGSLLHPNISFDIEFPELTGPIKGYVDSKLNALKANETEMSQQVVSLLWSRSFIPTSAGIIGGINVNKGLDNTVSELFSSALSSLFSTLLGDIIEPGSVVTSVELEVGVDLPLIQGALDPSAGLENVYEEKYRLNLPIGFFNDRLSVNVGGDYVRGSAFTENSEYFAGNINVEYELSPDGSLKIRAYNRYDETFEGPRNKVGVGLAYREEADSLKDLIRQIFGPSKRKKAKNEVIPETEVIENVEGGG